MKNANQQTTTNNNKTPKSAAKSKASKSSKPATHKKTASKAKAKTSRSKPGAHRFTDAQVREMRRLRKEKKMSYQEIASKFGLKSTGATWNVVNGKAYTDVK